MKKFALACILLAIAAPAHAKIEKASWGESPDRQKVEIFTLTNARGASAQISTYGATLVSLKVPGRDGKMADVVQGFDSAGGYKQYGSMNGAVVGRYANRIGNAKFTLDGKTYQLAANGGPNNIHGGPNGFNTRVYNGTAMDGANPSVILNMVSPDGDQGFPGKMDFTVSYTLKADNTLRIEYRATTDKPTVLNITNHAYFNLKGAGNGDVLNHRLQIFSDAVTPGDANHMATGEVLKVLGTGFDFTKPKTIGKDIDGPDPLIKATPGWDINFVVRGAMGKLRPAATVTEPEQGRVMSVWTTQPGVQLYVPNSGRTVPGKDGQQYGPRQSFCLETQHFANSPNIPSFPSTELRPGKIFYEVTEFRFTTAK
jgi:aldose 1-epimerase